MPSEGELACCVRDSCNTDDKNCIAGVDCVQYFLRNVGVSVAVISYLTVVLQISVIWLGCAIKNGPGPKEKPASNEIEMEGGQVTNT
mmetsp:Transcript_22981/g.35955  ORF Transcript_22981/g.35955 Transcript_22981/m.35955 type:complete len:87 (+) Transcript_22981:81-341(+)